MVIEGYDCTVLINGEKFKNTNWRIGMKSPKYKVGDKHFCSYGNIYDIIGVAHYKDKIYYTIAFNNVVGVIAESCIRKIELPVKHADGYHYFFVYEQDINETNDFISEKILESLFKELEIFKKLNYTFKGYKISVNNGFPGFLCRFTV